MGAVEELFGETIQKTQIWLNELRDELEWDHPEGLVAALRAALHALRDRLTPAEAAQLGAEMPLLVRGLYYEGWRPAAEPWKERHGEGFLARVEHDLGGYAHLRGAESVVRAVFCLLGRHVSPGEIDDVKRLLPAEVRDLW